MTESELLNDAIFPLDALSHGENPGYTGIVSGISVLEALQNDLPSPIDQSLRDLLAAAQDLLELANESDLPLGTADRSRAAEAAYGLRKYTQQL